MPTASLKRKLMTLDFSGKDPVKLDHTYIVLPFYARAEHSSARRHLYLSFVFCILYFVFVFCVLFNQNEPGEALR